MSIQAIQRYHAKVEKLIRYGGSRNVEVNDVQAHTS